MRADGGGVIARVVGALADSDAGRTEDLESVADQLFDAFATMQEAVATTAAQRHLLVDLLRHTRLRTVWQLNGII